MPLALAARLAALPLLMVLLAAEPAAAQVATGEAEPAGARHGGIIAADTTIQVYVPPVLTAGKNPSAKTAEIVVSYRGFPDEALEAFAYAVSIWETHVSSEVPIRIDAAWEDLSSDEDEGRTTLGAAGATLVFADAPGSLPIGFPLTETWYPAALAKAIADEDLTEGDTGEPDRADIAASFNSEFEGWYFGTDGNVPPGRYDFVTVVLHEIGHGLGFFGRIQYDDGEGNDECPTAPEGWGCWGLGTAGYPLIFDRFTEDAREVSLLNTAIYPNPSQRLGSVLRSGQVYFEGSIVRSANADIPVQLYAPATFELGSSYSHLDEDVFNIRTGEDPDSTNALMTPLVARQEAIHSPGAVTCAMFQEMGWSLGAGCLVLLQSGVAVELASFDLDRVNDEATLSWRVTRPDLVDRFEIVVEHFGEPVDTFDVSPDAGSGGRYETIIENLDYGDYTFELRIVTRAGVVIDDETSTVVPVPETLVVQPPFPNPFTEATVVDVFADARQRVEVSLYNAAGRRVAVLFDGVIEEDARRRVVVDGRGLPSGVYFVQAVGEDGVARSEAIVHVGR